jgi:hypothetical protein
VDAGSQAGNLIERGRRNWLETPAARFALVVYRLDHHFPGIIAAIGRIAAVGWPAEALKFAVSKA